MAEATLRLLTDATLLAETRRRAYQYAKPMFWPNVGRQYLDFFGQAVAESQKTVGSASSQELAAQAARISAKSFCTKGL